MIDSDLIKAAVEKLKEQDFEITNIDTLWGFQSVYLQKRVRIKDIPSSLNLTCPYRIMYVNFHGGEDYEESEVKVFIEGSNDQFKTIRTCLNDRLQEQLDQAFTEISKYR